MAIRSAPGSSSEPRTGTVVHVGYGSAYERIAWQDGAYVGADRFLEARRGFFFKASYLWRM